MYSRYDCESAEDFLLKYLANGPKDYREVKARARAKGFGRQKLKEARQAIGVTTINLGSGTFLWGLPGSEAMTKN